MTDPSDIPSTTTDEKRGCLFKALVAVAVSIVLLGGGGYLAYRYAIHRIVTVYTETAALDLGEAALPPERLGELDGRIASFAHALRNKRAVEPLVLTDEELTALVARSPDFRRLGGRARFSIADGELRSELSVPLERFGYPDRWFNGSAVFAVTLENGVLIITLRSAAVRGEPVPQWVVDRLRNRNLAKDVYEDSRAAAFVSGLESVELADGRITLVPRR